MIFIAMLVISTPVILYGGLHDTTRGHAATHGGGGCGRAARGAHKNETTTDMPNKLEQVLCIAQAARATAAKAGERKSGLPRTGEWRQGCSEGAY